MISCAKYRSRNADRQVHALVASIRRRRSHLSPWPRIRPTDGSISLLSIRIIRSTALTRVFLSLCYSIWVRQSDWKLNGRRRWRSIRFKSLSDEQRVHSFYLESSIDTSARIKQIIRRGNSVFQFSPCSRRRCAHGFGSLFDLICSTN